MADYQVIITGGNMIAVVPVGTQIDPATLRVYLYDTRACRWRAKRHVQSVLAHGNGWVEPDKPTTITIDEPIPARIEEAR